MTPPQLAPSFQSAGCIRPQPRQQSIEPGPLRRRTRPAESVPPSSLLSRVSVSDSNLLYRHAEVLTASLKSILAHNLMESALVMMTIQH